MFTSNVEEFINFLKTNKETYFEHNGKFIIMEVIELDNGNVRLKILPKKHFDKGNYQYITRRDIDKNLINKVVRYNEGFEITLLYSRTKRGIYSMFFKYKF